MRKSVELAESAREREDMRSNRLEQELEFAEEKLKKFEITLAPVTSKIVGDAYKQQHSVAHASIINERNTFGSFLAHPADTETENDAGIF